MNNNDNNYSNYFLDFTYLTQQQKKNKFKARRPEVLCNQNEYSDSQENAWKYTHLLQSHETPNPKTRKPPSREHRKFANFLLCESKSGI